MTTPQQPPYDPDATTQQPFGQQPLGAPLGAGPSQPLPVRTVRRGPGWGTYLITILAILLLVAVIVFVVQNDAKIDIKFLSWKRTGIKTSVALGAAGIVGFLAGLFLGVIPWLSARRQLRSLKRGQTTL